MLETCPLNGNVCIDLLRKEVDLLVCFGVFYLDKTTFTDGYKSTYVEWLPSGNLTVCCGKSISFVGQLSMEVIAGKFQWKWSFAGKILENPPKNGGFWSFLIGKSWLLYGFYQFTFW
jgi:hypothetical protein